ncbi:MFS transporter [Priestia flexa]|uniref:MFS transporter n=1 Tax=Priestia flexa TaxID=86664 RepID=UPI001CFE91B0|nr:MFS transporter [Priestia flexa]
MIRSWIIFTCLFMTVVSEVLLSPFYPQFFTDFFQVNGLQATSFFIICCRIVVIIITPIWGLLLKKWKIEKVSVYALVSISICKWMLSESSSFSMFLAFSLLLLVFQSCLYLLYPHLVSTSENKEKKAATYLLALNGGIILASLAGSFVISWEMPLVIYKFFACIDLIFAAVFARGMSGSKRVKDKEETVRSLFPKCLIGYLLAVFLFHIAHNMVRPYFTIFVSSEYGVDEWLNAVLYVMPSVMAIVLKFVLPPGTFKRSNMMHVLYGVLAFSSVVLIMQAFTSSLVFFIISRCLYGIGFYISLLIIDLYLFKQSNAETVSYYSWMLTAQNVGLLLAPLLALILVQNGKLHIPLIGGGMVLLAAVLSFIMAQQRLKFYKPVKENKG